MKIGVLILNHNVLSDESLKDFITSSKKQTAEKSQISLKINMGKYVSQIWSPIIKYTQALECHELYLNSNSNPQMLKEITHIDLTMIKKLNLRSNDLNSIEALSFLNLRNVQAILMGDNCISNLQCLKKQRFSQLQKYSIQSNPIKEFKWIERLQLRQKQLIDIQLNKRQRNGFESCLYLMSIIKLPNQSLKQHHVMKIKKTGRDSLSQILTHKLIYKIPQFLQL